MPFDWTEMLAVADGLVAGEVRGSREAVLRSAIGRYYYGAFNHAVRYFHAQGRLFRATGADHDLVREYLRDIGRADLASDLYMLHGWRKLADYRGDTWRLETLELAALGAATVAGEIVGQLS